MATPRKTGYPPAYERLFLSLPVTLRYEDAKAAQNARRLFYAWRSWYMRWGENEELKNLLPITKMRVVDNALTIYIKPTHWSTHYENPSK